MQSAIAEITIPPFAASRMKIERARKFLAELRDVLASYVASSPMRVRHDPADGGIIVGWESIGLLPGAVVGDCVHNLRSALDLMASELARANAKADKNVYFPFAKSEQELDSLIKGKNFHFCGQDAVDLLKTFKPYSGGNERLAALHQLDIQDKHTALIPHNGSAQVHLRATTTGLQVTNPDMHFMFPAGTTLERRPLVESLEELVEMVEGILEAFAALVAARTT